MALPEQIRKQTEAVQELYKQLNTDGETGEAVTADEQPEGTVNENNSGVPADSAVNEKATPSSGSERKTEDKKSEDEKTLVQKYKTLQGMYNAEVPRLHQQNKELQQKVQQMEQLLSTLSTQQPKIAPMPAPTFEPLISEKDVEEYGETLDVMRKVSREEYTPVAQKIAEMERTIQSLQSNVVPQLSNLAQKQAMTSEQQFWAQLTAEVPNWREVNDNPDFQTWLLQTDPLFGISRQTILEDAQRRQDVHKVITFFNTWMELNGGAAAYAAQNSQRDQTANELEKQIAPGKSRGTGTKAGNTAKTYSSEDIKQFFNDVRQGKFKGREAERDRIERDIFAAQREGRIVVNA